MNDNNGKIKLVMEIAERFPFYLQNSFSKKNWDSTLLQTEELYPEICQNVQKVDYQGAEVGIDLN